MSVPEGPAAGPSPGPQCFDGVNESLHGHRDRRDHRPRRHPIEAYLARPAHDASRGGVVVIHHMPGFDRGTKEIVRRFAELGYDAVCPNLYHREAPGADPDDAAAAARAAGGVPDDRLLGDVAGAATYLRRLPTGNGRVGVIGYCSGGRQAVLAACRLDIDAAVDCYGAFVTGTPPAGHPLQVATWSRCSATCAARCSACSATTTGSRPPSTSTNWSGCCTSMASNSSSIATTTPGMRSSR